jgi:hypothetical protein
MLSERLHELILSDLKEIRKYLKSDPINYVKKYRSIFGAGGGIYWQTKNTFHVKNRLLNTSNKQWAMENFDWEQSLCYFNLIS